MNVDTTVSQQWATRPDDERFLDLRSLRQRVESRKQNSWTVQADVRKLRAIPMVDNSIGLAVEDPVLGQERVIEPTNWSFGQLAQYAGAPAAYLRKLPNELACINLQWGLEKLQERDDALILAESLFKDRTEHSLRAMTTTSYGRIWDLQVVEAVERVNQDGRWVVPAASYTTKNPKRATTLYASDRDVFIFLVDPNNPIDVNGEQLFRGFYTWNSEVGSATFGLRTMLYKYVCDNRMIWGQTDVNELRIRHTSGAPNRFAYEGRGILKRYAEESTAKLVEGIKKAQQFELPEKKDSTWNDWLAKRGFTRTIAAEAVKRANEEEGQARSLWDIVNGITAYARSIPHTDARVDLEVKAGKLMQEAA